MSGSLEIFVAITSLIVGASHIVRSEDWAATYRRLHGLGRPGAFVNGGLHLFIGAMIVGVLRNLAWPDVVLTVFGGLLVIKGAISFYAPDLALKSMDRGASNPRGFQVAGIVVIAIGAWACYCLRYQTRAL